MLPNPGLTIEHKTVTHRASPSGRTTAIVHLEGGGEHGYGEEVTFQADDLLPESPRTAWPFSGSFGEFSLWLASLDLFERSPEYDVVRNYRRWAFEAAALDLGLRQADALFGGAREPEPVTFVVSPAPGFSEFPPGARLKIDAADLRPGLPVDVVDFKQLGDRAAVESALALYPDALVEDPPVVVPGARVSWDIAITLPTRSGGFPSGRRRSTSSRRGSEASRPCSTCTRSATPRESRCTAAGSTSSDRAERRSSCSPRSSIRAGPMTWRRPATTTRSRAPGCRRAHSRSPPASGSGPPRARTRARR